MDPRRNAPSVTDTLTDAQLQLEALYRQLENVRGWLNRAKALPTAGNVTELDRVTGRVAGMAETLARTTRTARSAHPVAEPAHADVVPLRSAAR